MVRGQDRGAGGVAQFVGTSTRFAKLSDIAHSPGISPGPGRAQRVDVIVPMAMDETAATEPQTAQSSVPTREAVQACRRSGKAHGDHVVEDIQLLFQHHRVDDRCEGLELGRGGALVQAGAQVICHLAEAEDDVAQQLAGGVAWFDGSSGASHNGLVWRPPPASVGESFGAGTFQSSQPGNSPPQRNSTSRARTPLR
jgi:hypothetical protein